MLDRAAVVLAERREEFARRIAEEAAKPIRTARVEIDRACDTFRFSAAVARTLTGETVPMDASTAGGHKLGIVLRVPIGVVGAISPVQLPGEPRGPQDRPGHRRRLPGRAEAGVGRPRSRRSRWPRCWSTTAASPTAGSTW